MHFTLPSHVDVMQNVDAMSSSSYVSCGRVANIDICQLPKPIASVILQGVFDK